MRDSKKLKEPKTIVTAENEKVFATETGTIWVCIIDQTGRRVPVSIKCHVRTWSGRLLLGRSNTVRGKYYP